MAKGMTKSSEIDVVINNGDDDDDDDDDDDVDELTALMWFARHWTQP